MDGDGAELALGAGKRIGIHNNCKATTLLPKMEILYCRFYLGVLEKIILNF